MIINGPLRLKVNAKFFITAEKFNSRRTTPTKPHIGGYGPFGVSQGFPKYAGSVNVAIPKGGLEFKFAKEFGSGEGGMIEVIEQVSTVVLARYENVFLAEESLDADLAEGSSMFAINWMALVDAIGNT